MNRFNALATAGLLLFASNTAFAQYVDGTEDNTDAGTVVTNTATVNYEVGGIAQVAESDDVTFVVDRVVLVTVASAGGVSVAPGAVDEVLEFTVTNDSNASLDFVLALSNGTGDEFNADNLGMFLEDGTTTGYQPAEDLAVPGNRLVALAEEGVKTIYIVGDIPDSATVSDGDTSDILLLATAYELAANGGGIVAETNTGVADDPNVEDTVFGDAVGDHADDLVQDGEHSATGTFTVATATITVTKSSVVISDPFNGSTNPKAIPGAVIEYCILISNSGGTAASNVAVSDPIPANTTYDAGTILIDSDCDTSVGATAEDDDAAGADETDGAAGSFDATPGSEQVNTEVANLATGTDTATIFRVIVD